MSDTDQDPQLGRRAFCAAAAALVALGSAGCGSSGDDDDEASSPAAPASGDLASKPVQRGVLHTEADFQRMREKVAAGAQPWLDGWNALLGGGFANLGYTPAPLGTVVRGGTGQNFGRLIVEMQRTYQLALRWKVSGDTAYADAAVRLLNAWSSTMTQLTGNADRFLAAGIYGYQWANAAEIMRSYPGWAAEDMARCQQWLLRLFYPLSHDFLTNHNGTEHSKITNYWANWDLCSIAGILAIGVFCDRPDLVAEAVDYYEHGRGNGATSHNVCYMHPGHLGQWQESGRDQGHATLGIALCGAICEMAWNQGIDLYALGNNRLLAGAEYVAKSNLRDENGALYSLPFATYTNSHGTMTAVSDAARPLRRPAWELVYNHYVRRRGLSAPWVTAMAAQLRPEGRDGGDQPSFGTLTSTRDAFVADTPPSGLTAHVSAGEVVLSWWGSATASSYNVKRGPSAEGPYTTIASVSDPRTYTDTPGNGIWHYCVTAVGGGGESAASSARRVVLPGELIVRLPLDGEGATADASGKGKHGEASGGASWGSGRKGTRALALDGESGFLALPGGVLAEVADFTIALWVYWDTAATNARVFDFGSNDVRYMALLPRDNKGRMRFTVTGTSWFGEQSIAAAALPTGRWVHVAVTLSGRTGTLYVDGQPVGSNDAMTLAPWQLCETRRNWLGRSQYATDPRFKGRLQDLRIYSGALAASEIAALAAA